MSGDKHNNGGSASGGGQTIEVPILGLLQTDGETRDLTNDTLDKLPKVNVLILFILCIVVI